MYPAMWFCEEKIPHMQLIEVWTKWSQITIPNGCFWIRNDTRSALVQTPWTSYQIRNIAGCACAGNAGKVFPRHRLQRKPVISDPNMHHGTCVTHVPWCMSGSLTRGGGKNIPGIPAACANHNFTYLARGPLPEPMLTIYHEFKRGPFTNMD